MSGAPKPLESKPISVTAIETAAEAVADTITAADDLHADEAYLARRCCDLDRTDVARR